MQLPAIVTTPCPAVEFAERAKKGGATKHATS
jgi:hypothetical protein